MPVESIARELARRAGALSFGPPVTHVYNPLDYAWNPAREYFRRYGRGPREVLLVGMNPGPFGMAQTGVPFGDVAMVRDWLGIEAPVAKPDVEHPKRPVEGFACGRSEVSGTRLWGWARDRFVTPERFFARFFVWNYCPLCFMESSGRNRTPDKLPAAEREALFGICSDALRELLNEMRPAFAIGVGRFAEERIAAVARASVRVGRVLHPSPASPAANTNWARTIEHSLRAMGIRL